MTRIAHWTREAVLWVGGALGALCLLALLAGWLFNVTPLVFGSGSMSPTYDTGALGIARQVPATDVAVGDVVSVRDSNGGRVTHRVVSIGRAADGGTTLQLQGDANDVPDLRAYRVDDVDRVMAGVPLAGYVLNAAASPFGLVAGALLAGTALFLGFTPGGGGGRRATTGRARLVLPVGVGALLLGGTVGMNGQAPWAFTSAYWTDTATATVTATAPAGDTTPPVFASFDPADGAANANWLAIDCNGGGNDSRLCTTVTDNQSGVSTVTVRVVRTSAGVQACWTGVTWSTTLTDPACTAALARQSGTALNGFWRTGQNYAAATMANAVFTATYTATDVAGNVATGSVTFRTDTAGPTISTYGPANGSSRTNDNNGNSSWNKNCSQASNRICITVTDAGAGVDFSSATFTLSGTSGNNNGKCWDGSQFVTGTSCSVAAPNRSGNVIYSDNIPDDSPGVQNGTYSLTWRVKDLAGNLTTGSITFTVT